TAAPTPTPYRSNSSSASLATKKGTRTNLIANWKTSAASAPAISHCNLLALPPPRNPRKPERARTAAPQSHLSHLGQSGLAGTPYRRPAQIVLSERDEIGVRQ